MNGLEKVVVAFTGANGFLGRAYAQQNRFQELRLVSRINEAHADSCFFKANLGPNEDYSHFLTGCDVIIHAAARVHMMNESPGRSLETYRTVNVEGTANLAEQAARAGVRRFIFLSSIKVNGESTSGRKPFRYDDVADPHGPYALSKFEAEERLKAICARSGMEFVIVRPPLIYGPGAKANFAALMALAQSGMPLPLANISNKRSFVALPNMISLLDACVVRPGASNQVLLAGDDEDISTTELVKILSMNRGRRALLFPLPSKWAGGLGKILGKTDVIDRLYGDLQVDIAHTKKALEWEPPMSVRDGLSQCF